MTAKTVKKEQKHKTITQAFLEFKPSLEEYKTALIDSFTEIKNRIQTLTDLGPQCFRMMNGLEEKIIFQINDDYPLYAEALAELNDMIDDSMKEAEKIREEYKPFLEVLEMSIEKYIETKLGSSSSAKNLNVERCSEILSNLRDMEEELKHKGNETNLRMFSISTKELRTKIKDAISGIIKKMLDKMAKYCEKRTKDILGEKDEFMVILKAEIGDDFGKYDKLQQKLTKIDGFIKEKEAELNNVDQVINSIEDQKHLEVKPARKFIFNN